eukprot:scaffold175_cov177-Amphora_coffeaeformis.AAC.18
MSCSAETKSFRSLAVEDSQSGDTATEESWAGRSEFDGGSERSSPIEDSRASSHAVTEDGSSVLPDDVMCGRDRWIHSHPGNRRFRHLINEYRERYQSAKYREHKTSMTTEIVNTVKRHGGRFLKLEGSFWREVDQSCAHEKVSHALRSAKDPNRAKPKRTRNVPIRPPSDEEERFFQILLADQQVIYERLRKTRVGGFTV